MSFFRKLGRQLAPAFRKASNDLNVFGRQLNNTTRTISTHLDKGADVVGKINRVLPNPILKGVQMGLSGASDVSDAVGKGGQALRAVSRGDFIEAGKLTQDAVNEGTSGVAKVGLAGVGLGIV